MKHPFIFQPGQWLGKGKITLNMVEEELNFSTVWNVIEQDIAGKIQCVQQVQVEGLGETMQSEIYFFDLGSKDFCVEMQNDNIGHVAGTGVHDEKLIAWEFRENDKDFEGIETYYLQEDGSYLMKGEYVTSDQLHTQIEGKIWREEKE